MLFGMSSANAVPVLTVNSDAVTADVGADIVVDVTVSNLATERVGAYDFRITWNSTVLRLADVDFGSGLDGPANSFQQVDSDTTSSLVLAEASLDTLATQTDSVLLATLTFEALENGESPFQVEGSLS